MNDTLPRSLMRSLVYPAVLGASLVYVLSDAIRARSSFVEGVLFDVRYYFAIWLIVYFSVPFLLLNHEHYPKRYGALSFGIDLADVLVIMGAFFFLGFVTREAPSLPHVYLCLLLVPVLAAAGNLVLGRGVRWRFSALGVSINLVMLLGGHRIEWLNWVAVFALLLLLVVYLRVVVKVLAPLLPA